MKTLADEQAWNIFELMVRINAKESIEYLSFKIFAVKNIVVGLT